MYSTPQGLGFVENVWMRESSRCFWMVLVQSGLLRGQSGGSDASADDDVRAGEVEADFYVGSATLDRGATWRVD
jgi:hypothetical protein